MANGCANVHGINANGFHGFYFGINFIKSYAYTIVHSVLFCDVQCAHTHTVGGKYLAQNVILHKEKVVNNERGISLFHATSRTFSAQCSTINIRLCICLQSRIISRVHCTWDMLRKWLCALFHEITFLQFLPISLYIHFVN